MSKPSLVWGAVVAVIGLGLFARDRLRAKPAANAPPQAPAVVLRLDFAALADRDLMAESMQGIADMASSTAWALEIGRLKPGWGPYRQLMLLQALQAGMKGATGRFEIRLGGGAGPLECQLAMQLARELGCDVVAHPDAMSLDARTFQYHRDSATPLPPGIRIMPGIAGAEESPVDQRNTYAVRLRDGVSHF